MLKLPMGWAETTSGKVTRFNRNAMRSAVFISTGTTHGSCGADGKKRHAFQPQRSIRDGVRATPSLAPPASPPQGGENIFNPPLVGGRAAEGGRGALTRHFECCCGSISHPTAVDHA